MVGEIFCRLNTFANFDLIRLVEEQGGECWLSDIGEWVWYTDDEQRRRLADEGRTHLARRTLVRVIKGEGHAPRRARPLRAVRTTTSWATRSRTTCARSSS